VSTIEFILDFRSTTSTNYSVIMTQHTEGGGPSNATGSSLPFRQRGQEAPIPISRRDIEVRIENAVSSGRTISETLADELRHGDFANDEENNLRPILTLAEELRNYQSPVEFTIGVVGDSGVGKRLSLTWLPILIVL
jgi:hypothetical protein